MIRLYSLLFIVFFSMSAGAQVKDPLKERVPDTMKIPVSSELPSTDLPATTTEQQLESITEANADNETEDDSYLQELKQYLRDPINLNTVDEATLKELLVLTPLQIQSFITYRNVFGKFINIYELQAIPAWDVTTIQKLRPYVTVRQGAEVFKSFGKRFSGGVHSILVRGTQVVEKAEGYKRHQLKDPNGDLLPDTTRYIYPGPAQKLLLRYKYAYRNLLQYGIVAEKDAGEEFFTGNQKLQTSKRYGIRGGFDFYSIHLFARNIGIVKALALGDFTVNLGQGLTSWQSLAFRKSSDVINIKRQAAVLRPYNSAAEINFHRGVGITIGGKKLEATVFGSYRNIDGNFDSSTIIVLVDDENESITSLSTSGYHRTQSEFLNKGVLTQKTFGGNVAYNNSRLHIGVNGVQYHFDVPLVKAPEVYNKYALSGTDFGNYSVDYSYTFRNMHFFGEAATSNKSYMAYTNGLLLNVDEKVDMSFLYRNISKGYQSLYTNAFTESTYPNNENGFYAGISVKPGSSWRIDAYADFYKFPWLKFRVDAPSDGHDYLAQVTYKPNKQFEMYVRYRTETKQIDASNNLLTMPVLLSQPRQNLRTQFSSKISSSMTFRSRVEMVWFDKRGPNAEKGYLGYVELLYKPLLQRWSGNVRLQYYETDGYNSRLYAYENDVLYSFSIPVFYLKGFRYYVNLNYDVSKRLSLWARVAQYVVGKNVIIGSGYDELPGRYKTEIKLQALYQFR